jgi:hypothetical protein
VHGRNSNTSDTLLERERKERRFKSQTCSSIERERRASSQTLFYREKEREEGRDSWHQDMGGVVAEAHNT